MRSGMLAWCDCNEDKDLLIEIISYKKDEFVTFKALDPASNPWVPHLLTQYGHRNWFIFKGESMKRLHPLSQKDRQFLKKAGKIK